MLQDSHLCPRELSLLMLAFIVVIDRRGVLAPTDIHSFHVAGACERSTALLISRGQLSAVINPFCAFKSLQRAPVGAQLPFDPCVR